MPFARYIKLWLFPVAFALLFPAGQLRAQGWQWARNPSYTAIQGGSEGWLVKTDGSNHVCIAGYYFGNRFAFGPYSFNNPVNSANNTQTVVAKYDASGNLSWADASHDGQSRPISIATDKQGNLFVFGLYTTDSISFGNIKIGNADFDTSGSTVSYGFYLLKYSPAGSLLWAKTGATDIHPGTGNLHPGGITVDAAGSVYISSMFSANSFIIEGHSVTNYGSNGTDDIFLAKFDASGSFQWIKSFGGLKDDYVADIALGPGGRLYLAGHFYSGFISFGSTRLYTDVQKAYIACLDTSGNGLWAIAGNTQSKAEAIAANADNLYVAGGFSDTISVGSYFFHNSNGGYYILKLDGAGNITKGTALHYNGPVSSCCSAFGLTTDKCGSIWISANLDKYETLALNSSTNLSCPAGSNDPMFFAGYRDDGTLVRSVALQSGAGNNTGLSNTGLSADTSGNIYLAGDYRELNPFVIGHDSLRVQNGAIATMFVAKYYPDDGCDTVPTNPTQYPDVPIIRLIPNPAGNETVLDYNGSLGTGPAAVAIRDVAGRHIATYNLAGHQTLLPLGGLPDGVYVCILKVESRPTYTLLLTVMK